MWWGGERERGNNGVMGVKKEGSHIKGQVDSMQQAVAALHLSSSHLIRDRNFDMVHH